MRAIVQRVSEASVRIGGKIVGRCGPGLLLLVGVHRDDGGENAVRLSEKIANLRIFNDADGKMNLSILDAYPERREILAISNFTVYGDTKKNRRPSFVESAGFDKGAELFVSFLRELANRGVHVETGEFGADMQVSLVNDGPVTVIVDA